MWNEWWTALAEITQCCVDMGEMRAFTEALKAMYRPSHQIQVPLRSSDRSTLLIKKCWSEHFEGLFDDQCIVQESSLAKIPQVDVKLELDDPPTCEEIKNATIQLKVGKPQKCQFGEEVVLDKLQDLFTSCWEKGTQP